MSIIILSLGVERGNSCHARVLCGDHEFDAFISGNKACLEPLLNEEIYVEIAFEQVISWRELDEFIHDQSGIKAAQDTEGAIILAGRVRNIVNIDDVAKIIDIDLELGSEFLTLSSEELQGKLPALGNGVEVVVSGLCFYPVNI